MKRAPQQITICSSAAEYLTFVSAVGGEESAIELRYSDGVEFRALGEVTLWNKNFNGIGKDLQPAVNRNLKKSISAAKLKSIADDNGNVKLLSTGNFEGWTSESAFKCALNDAEVITIPTGGTANLKYYKGKFVDSGNNLAISADVNKYDLKFIYYWMLTNNETIQSYFRGSGVKHPDMPQILALQLPIPPLPIQQEIVRILDQFTELEAELEARKKQYEYYRDLLLTFPQNESNASMREISADEEDITHTHTRRRSIRLKRAA